MPEREFTPPTTKISQHDLRKQYVENWEIKYNLLQDTLTDKNDKPLTGAALISRKASILRKLEFKDAEKLPTFAKIIEKQKTESEVELKQTITEIAPELEAQTHTIKSNFGHFLFTFPWATRLRQAAVGALIIVASYLGARLYFEKQHELDDKIALVQNNEEPQKGYELAFTQKTPIPTPSPPPIVFEEKIAPPTPIPEKENPPKLQEIGKEPGQESPDLIVTIPTPEAPPLTSEKPPIENAGSQEKTAMEHTDNLEPAEKKINIDLNIAFPVGKNHPLPKEFTPPLVKMTDYKDIRVVGSKVNTEEGKGQPVIAQNLSSLFKDAQEAGINDIYVTSCFRSYSVQDYLYQKAKRLHGENQTTSAAPAHTEHRTGLACDFTTRSIGFKVDSEAGFEKTPASKWLNENAHKYGFIMTYTMAGVDGRISEPWHWRYVGVEIATNFFERKYLEDKGFNTIETLAFLNQQPQQIAMVH